MSRQVPSLVVANAEEWRQWLAQQASESAGVFLTIVKEGKQTATTSLTYQQALDEALCYGWIDNGGGGKLSDISYSFRFTPRRAKSSFSLRNVSFVERLEREGRIQPPGRAVIDAAKAGGRYGIANKAKRASRDQLNIGLQARKKALIKTDHAPARTCSTPEVVPDAPLQNQRRTRSGRPAPSYKE